MESASSRASMKVVNTIGVMILLGCIWALVAHSLGWQDATLAEAIVFSIVVYAGFKTAK